MLALGLTAAFVIGGPIANAQGRETASKAPRSSTSRGDLHDQRRVRDYDRGDQGRKRVLLFPPETSDSCYTVSGLGTTTVTITRIGSGRTCKEISHVEYTTGTPPRHRHPTDDVNGDHVNGDDHDVSSCAAPAASGPAQNWSCAFKPHQSSTARRGRIRRGPSSRPCAVSASRRHSGARRPSRRVGCRHTGSRCQDRSSSDPRLHGAAQVERWLERYPATA